MSKICAGRCLGGALMGVLKGDFTAAPERPPSVLGGEAAVERETGRELLAVA